MSITKLQEFINKSKNIVFFGGAGVSTESGIPDFRSVDGLYNQQFDHSPETILSSTFFKTYPKEFYKFLRTKILVGDYQPNAAHFKLAELERAGKLSMVVTQNIDGLHQIAGSKNVIELHGSAQRYYCVRCHEKSSKEVVMDLTKDVPYCECGGVIRPDITLYEEMLPKGALEQAIAEVAASDMFIIGGTSLNVYPAAGLVNMYVGNKLVLLNRDETYYDSKANLIIRENIGEVLAQVQV